MKRTDISPHDVAPKSLAVIKTIEQSLALFSPNLVNRIQNLTEEFDDIRHSTPDIVRKLVQMYKSKYAYHTIALEGNTLSPGEIQLIIEQGITIRGKSLKEHLEAKNIPKALEVILDIAKTPKRSLLVSGGKCTYPTGAQIS